jgi:aspartyl-tRNA(Asn)/glutamyl-tRNA(Gln) amidotransferase subunit C
MATSLTRAEVARIAELARLELTASELDLFTRQLGDILDYVEQIRGLDTTGVAPTSHVLNRPVERPDENVPPLPRPEALSNAPDAAREAGLFKVPRVL